MSGGVKLFKLSIDAEKFGTDFSDRPIAFSLIPYDGDPDLHINMDTRPADINSYEWSSFEPYEERIVISSEERQNKKTKDYYLAIDAGWQSSMFTLKAYPIDLDKLYLVFDFPESGKLIAD